jgi:hypothetical protein
MFQGYPANLIKSSLNLLTKRPITGIMLGLNTRSMDGNPGTDAHKNTGDPPAGDANMNLQTTDSSSDPNTADADVIGQATLAAFQEAAVKKGATNTQIDVSRLMNWHKGEINLAPHLDAPSPEMGKGESMEVQGSTGGSTSGSGTGGGPGRPDSPDGGDGGDGDDDDEDDEDTIDGLDLDDDKEELKPESPKDEEMFRTLDITDGEINYEGKFPRHVRVDKNDRPIDRFEVDMNEVRVFNDEYEFPPNRREVKTILRGLNKHCIGTNFKVEQKNADHVYLRKRNRPGRAFGKAADYIREAAGREGDNWKELFANGVEGMGNAVGHTGEIISETGRGVSEATGAGLSLVGEVIKGLGHGGIGVLKLVKAVFTLPVELAKGVWAWVRKKLLNKDALKIIALAIAAGGLAGTIRAGFMLSGSLLKTTGRFIGAGLRTIGYPFGEIGKNIWERGKTGAKWGVDTVTWPPSKTVSGGMLSRAGGHIRNFGADVLRNTLRVPTVLSGTLGMGIVGTGLGTLSGIRGAITGYYPEVKKKKVDLGEGKSREEFAHGGALELAQATLNGVKDFGSTLRKTTQFGPLDGLFGPGADGKWFSWFRKLKMQDVNHVMVAHRDAKYAETLEEIRRESTDLKPEESWVDTAKLHWRTLMNLPSDKAKSVANSWADLANIEGQTVPGIVSLASSAYRTPYSGLGNRLSRMDEDGLKEFAETYDYEKMVTTYELMQDGVAGDLGSASAARRKELAEQVREFLNLRKGSTPTLTGIRTRAHEVWRDLDAVRYNLESDGDPITREDRFTNLMEASETILAAVGREDVHEDLFVETKPFELAYHQLGARIMKMNATSFRKFIDVYSYDALVKHHPIFDSNAFSTLGAIPEGPQRTAYANNLAASLNKFLGIKANPSPLDFHQRVVRIDNKITNLIQELGVDTDADSYEGTDMWVFENAIMYALGQIDGDPDLFTQVYPNPNAATA